MNLRKVLALKPLKRRTMYERIELIDALHHRQQILILAQKSTVYCNK